MLEIILQALMGALCISIALCGLLTDKMKLKYYVVVFVLPFVLAILAFYINIGQTMTIPVICICLITIFSGEKRHPIFNVCMSCIGYSFVVFANQLTLLFFDKILNIPDTKIVSDYYVPFSLFYALLEVVMLGIVRIILYKLIKIQRFFGKGNKIKYGLLANLLSFLAILVANIVLGEKVKYNQSVLIMNSVLFAICFVINTIVLLYCIRQIQAEELIKMDESKRIMTQNYIDGLECMINESRSIRHDYKNLLSSISGYLRENDYIGLQKYFDENIRNFWATADQQGQIWKVLAEVHPIELKGFLYEKVLKATAAGVPFHVMIQHDFTLAYPDMGNLIRVLGNLLDNAIDAASEAEAKYIELRISDNGSEDSPGIYFIIRNTFGTQPDLAHIFEKGYTTKGEGHGNGLYYVNEYLNSRDDIFCIFSIEKNEFVQSLEIINGN